MALVVRTATIEFAESNLVATDCEKKAARVPRGFYGEISYGRFHGTGNDMRLSLRT
ncbi:hypothetical protein GLA29479_2600 [Lysobacter antibioticus]|nr:hypothetical protein GLA29479_2600 [Lysobacter antibioticus]